MGVSMVSALGFWAVWWVHGGISVCCMGEMGGAYCAWCLCWGLVMKESGLPPSCIEFCLPGFDVFFCFDLVSFSCVSVLEGPLGVLMRG